jgi:hypothetical protein
VPLPFIIGAAAAIAAGVGIKSGVEGAMKMKEASETMKSTESRHKENIERFKKFSNIASREMDILGKNELKIIKSFDKFSKLIEKIQGKPQFKTYNKDGVSIPSYSAEKIKEVSIGAGILLGGIGGAAVGTAGGFAAAGATTAAVMAIGTASTGTAIASLSGVAATNATLAALGGGAIAAGGGGIALGTTILGTATLGVGLLVGGIIFNITGKSLSNKADEAFDQMIKAEKEINSICLYLKKLSKTASNFNIAITKVNRIYRSQLHKLNNIVNVLEKSDWEMFTTEEKIITENTALLVNLLYNMGKVQLVLKSDNGTESNKVNTKMVYKAISDSDKLLKERDLVAL